jgi:hypothetical protein
VAKDVVRDVGLLRISRMTGVSFRTLAKISDYLSDEAEWVAVVHADGNGLGDVFTNFDRYVSAPDSRSYASAISQFSAALDETAAATLAAAWDAVNRDAREGRLADVTLLDGTAAVLPLVVGGDDLTFVCDGSVALALTHAYLRRFETATSTGVVADTLRRGGRPPRIGVSAGVAIVKRHFPFSLAYELAADLTGEAKSVKRPEHAGPDSSALAFHVLLDSVGASWGDPGSSWDDVKARLTRGPRPVSPETGDTAALGRVAAGGTVLTAQPYLVSDAVDTPWAKGRHWEDLVRRATALRAENPDSPGERLLPANQVHELVAGLFLGREIVDGRYRSLLDRYQSIAHESGIHDRHPLVDLQGDRDSLFWSTADGTHVSGLLDAVNAAAFGAAIPSGRSHASGGGTA